MKSKSIIIGIFLSIALVATAAGLYWMAGQTRAGEHHLAISTVRQIQQLESQWSVEVARVRSDPFADFDALTQFIPRMDRLKETLTEAIQSTPDLPNRLVNSTNAYLSAISAKEERIERFKTGYAVLRNSVRYLPLAATNVMQQMQTRGANSAFVKNVATVTEEINTYLTSPEPPEKERLARVLVELGDDIATRHPALVNTAMNFVAHGQVLLEKQAPTEEIFQEATSDRIGELSETIIRGLESEIDQAEALAAWYERGIVGTGVVLWLMWLTIAFKIPRGKDQTRNDGAASRPSNPLLPRQPADLRPDGSRGDGAASRPSNPLLLGQQADPRQNESLERLTADLMKAEQFSTKEADPTAATEFTAYQIGVELVAEQMITLAEHINSSAEALTDLPDSPADNGAGTAAEDAPDADREIMAAVVASIHTQTNDIVELAKRLPALAPKRDGGDAQLDLNDYLDEVADHIQAKSRSLILKELNPIHTVRASEPDVYLMLTNIMENAAWAIQGRGQKKGIVRVETKQESDNVVITITDNGVGIRPEHRKKVFTPFYTTREGVRGMGLTITRHLVEKYQGSLVMNSLPGHGTMVRLTLPTRTQSRFD